MNYVHSKVLCAGLEASRGPKIRFTRISFIWGPQHPIQKWNKSAKGTRVQAKLSKRQRQTGDRHFRFEKPQPPKHLDWGHHSRAQKIFHSMFSQYLLGGTGGRIQLLLNRLPDSSVSSLIRAGWCQEERTSRNFSIFIYLKPIIPRDRQLPHGD